MSSSEEDEYPAAAAFVGSDDDASSGEDYSSLMPKAPVKKSKSGGFESMNIFPPVFRAIRGKGYRVRAVWLASTAAALHLIALCHAGSHAHSTKGDSACDCRT